jgi:probable HAF family extracellular repeat protein
MTIVSVFLSAGGSVLCQSQSYAVTDLGVLPGGVGSYATGINNNGQVIGFSANSSNGFLWQNGVLVPLNAAIPGCSPSVPTGINNAARL